MAGEEDSFVRRHWEGYKEFWGERFSFLENYSRFIKRDKPLPSWSEADVEEFIASDPLHGPTLKTAREAAKFGAVGGIIGAVSTAGVAWKYSRSLHGMLQRRTEAPGISSYNIATSILALSVGFLSSMSMLR